MPEPLLKLQKANRFYRRRLAMSCDLLEIFEGERLGIAGDNGSGKSTLLRVLGGMTRLSRGTINASRRWQTASIIYVPQDGGIYSDLTIDENINIYERLFGRRPAFDGLREFLETVQLDRYTKMKVRTLSGGYQKLALVATAFSTAADILILDEPTADLQHTHVEAMAKLIGQSRGQFKALILAEHAPLMLNETDRVITMVRP